MKLSSALFGLGLGLAAAAHADFTLSSPVLKENGNLANNQVFNGFGCSGANISPALSWFGAPAGTKSFAVTVYDPDAPTGSGWWHWVLFNLPADTHELPAGAGTVARHLLPATAMQSRTDFGKPGYGGPCPPKGDKPHHYIFTVYALKTDKIDLDADASPAMVGFYLNQHKLATATLTGLYSH